MAQKFSLEADKDICEVDSFENANSHSAKIKRAAPFSCEPVYPQNPGNPDNLHKISKWTGCETRVGFEYSNIDDIVAAMKQNIKYILSESQQSLCPDQGN